MQPLHKRTTRQRGRLTTAEQKACCCSGINDCKFRRRLGRAVGVVRWTTTKCCITEKALTRTDTAAAFRKDGEGGNDRLCRSKRLKTVCFLLFKKMFLFLVITITNAEHNKIKEKHESAEAFSTLESV